MGDFAWHPLRLAMLVLASLVVTGCRDKQEELQQALQSQQERIHAELKAAGFDVEGTIHCPDQLLLPKVGDWVRCGVNLESDDAQLYEVAVKRVTNEGTLLHVKPVALSVDSEDIKARAAQLLAAHPDGYDIESITCPEHLIGAPGKSVRCSIELADGRRAGLTAILEGIQGGLSTQLFAMKPGTYTSTAVRYLVTFDVPPEQVDQAIRDMLDEQGKKGPDSLPDATIACADFLPANEGAEIRCPLLHGGSKTHEATVRYESADAVNGRLKAMIEVLPSGQAG